MTLSGAPNSGSCQWLSVSFRSRKRIASSPTSRHFRSTSTVSTGRPPSITTRRKSSPTPTCRAKSARRRSRLSPRTWRKYRGRMRPDWDAIKDEVMYRAVRRKFELHPPLRELLLATGDEPIVESAPSDFYW
ncbi:MAG: NADAR domain-containing protein, partial [Xanthobacteraceae bacterium]